MLQETTILLCWVLATVHGTPNHADDGFCSQMYQQCTALQDDTGPPRVGKAGPRGPPGLPGDPAVVDYDAINRQIAAKSEEILRDNDARLDRCEAKIEELETKIRPLLLTDCGKVSESDSKSWNETGGVFDIYPGNQKMEVYCDLTTDGGGWLVFQRRMDGSVDFFRNWNDYVSGFGNKAGEFWLGLEALHRLTSSGEYELRIDMEDWEGNKRFAKYTSFRIGDAASVYLMYVGQYSGDAGDSFSGTRGMKFTTKDKDSDTWSKNCAVRFKGAWWYSDCHASNLNGFYFRGGPHASDADGVNWHAFKGHHYSLKFTEMKIKLL